MRTNYVPAMVMLSAGFVDCVIAIRQQMPMWDFIKQLLAVLIIFFILGCIARIVLSKAIDAMADKKENEEDAENSEESQEGEETADKESNADA